MKMNKIATSALVWNLLLQKNPTIVAFPPSPRLLTKINTKSLQLHPLAITPKNDNAFVNNGPFSFMQPALSLVGFKEGKTTYYGPAVDVDPSDYPTEEEQATRRALAQQNMYNIGEEERQRRREAGQIFQKISLAYAILSSVLLDDGTINGMITRFLIVIPLFLAVGYTKSADTGL